MTRSESLLGITLPKEYLSQSDDYEGDTLDISVKPKRRGRVFYAAGTINGQRIRKSLRTDCEATAKEQCAIYEARLWKRCAYDEAAVRTFEEAAVSYLEAGGEGRYLPPILQEFRDRALTTIMPGDITNLAVRLYEGGSTRNRQVIVTARAVINHAADRGWCSHIRVKQFRAPKPKRTARGRDWHEDFMAQADRDGLPHLSAALLFMAQTGARVSEVAGVYPEHLDLANGVVLLAKTKASEWETRYLTSELVARIANLSLRKDEPVFGYSSRHGIYRRMKAVCRRAGIEWSSPHEAGRHSFASNSLDMGASIRDVMDAGGYKSGRLLLETYAHSRDAGRKVATLLDGTNLTQRLHKVRASK